MTKSHITREDCVLRHLLDNQAAALPNKVFLKNDDGREWTYSEVRREVLKAAGGLQALGVKQGDHVLCWMPNSPEMLFVWFAINYIGAVFVPVNLAYRGRLLEHAVSLSDAKVGVVHADLAPRLADIELAQLKDIVIFGGAPANDFPPYISSLLGLGAGASARAARAPDRALG